MVEHGLSLLLQVVLKASLQVEPEHREVCFFTSPVSRVSGSLLLSNQVIGGWHGGNCHTRAGLTGGLVPFGAAARLA